jgi:nucleoside phosphorylase
MASRANTEYTVGWIAALPLEMAAASVMLDHPPEKPQKQHPRDSNIYYLGSIGEHYVVITCLPEIGTTNAAIAAAHMVISFPSVRFILMVGIGGGIPSKTNDIRLGDVVVSKPEGTLSGVVRHDFGKSLAGGKFEHTGTLNKPPPVLLSGIAGLRTKYAMGQDKIRKHLSDAKYTYPGQKNDKLYQANYNHVLDKNTCEESCDVTKVENRLHRDENDHPCVHYGIIASGDQVIKDAEKRDKVRKRFGALCVEMEAGGLMGHFPCLVIRGICDYADSHKNKDWQPYAAATAAAYAKELLGEITPQVMDNAPTVTEALIHRGVALTKFSEDMQNVKHGVRDMTQKIIPRSSRRKKSGFLSGGKGLVAVRSPQDRTIV